MHKPIIFIAAMLLFFHAVYAQNGIDSVALKAPQLAAVTFFNKAINQQSRLYNGAEYNDYPANIKNNPYYADFTNWQKSDVTFDGYKFNDVAVKYDIFKDQLVALLFNNISKYILYAPRVSGFDISGHHFFYIGADTVKNSPGSGFYDLLYDGKIRVLGKYSKTIQNAVSTTDLNVYFTGTKATYYLQRGIYINEVGSQGELLKLLQDHKKELQQYIKSNNIKYRKQPEKSLVAIVSYYNHLKN